MTNAKIRLAITILATLSLLSCIHPSAAGETKATFESDKELAQAILANPDLKLVLDKAHKLLGTGLRAGSGYQEVWIRDLNTFIELALDVQPQNDIREALLIFFHFQGEDGNIVDGYVPKSKARVNYKYIKSKSRSEYLAHKNTVETDQEASLLQAVHKYIQKTGDLDFLNEKINGKTVLKRMEFALEFLLEHRYVEKYQLLWGATTADWGDVQPEHSWGVELDKNSHRTIDIYDNAMFIIALENFLDLAGPGFSGKSQWQKVLAQFRKNTMKHLWDQTRHKFIPHIYLEGSPFPNDFDENRIYYHGGTTIAMEASLLSGQQIRQVYLDMINNKRFIGAGSIGLTLYPCYPKDFYANKDMAPWSYQNGGDWTWFGGRTIQQFVRLGLLAEAYQEALPMIERVKRNNGFYEWYTVENKPKGSGLFRGSAGVLGKAIIMLQDWAQKNK